MLKYLTAFLALATCSAAIASAPVAHSVGKCYGYTCVESINSYGGSDCLKYEFTDKIALYRLPGNILKVSPVDRPSEVIIKAPYKITQDYNSVSLSVGRPFEGFGMLMIITDDNNLPSRKLPQVISTTIDLSADPKYKDLINPGTSCLLTEDLGFPDTVND